MSDFLTNLVGRSLGVAPVIQPRLPSLFEPARRHAESFAESWEQRAVELPDNSAKSTLDKAGEQTIAPREAEAPGLKFRPEKSVGPAGRSAIARAGHPEESEDGSTHPLAEKLPAHPMRSNHATVSTEAKSAPSSAVFSELSGDERLRNEVHVSAEPAPPPTPARALVAPPLGLQSVVEEDVHRPMRPPGRAKSETSRFASTIPLDTKNPPLDQLRGSAAARAASKLVDPARVPMPDSPPPMGAATEPAWKARFEFARHVPAASQSKPAEPTIQVTIGRIEVRAVSSPSASPKERSSPPVMSLSDYLQQRSKRGGA